MKMIQYILGVVIMVVVSACSSPIEKIDNRLEAQDQAFIYFNSDYMYDESISYYYEVEGANPLANDDLRQVAFKYAEAASIAKRSRDMAYYVANNYDENFKLAPNWFEEKQKYDRMAEIYEPIAERLKEELKNYIASSNFSPEEGGIWVYHKLSYKEYVYKFYVGPYIKESIFLFSKDGENEVFKEEYYKFADTQLAEILDMTGTKYIVKRSLDYEF